MLETISQLVHEKRKSLGLTIEQLAQRSGVSVSLISRIERGDLKNISINKLNDLAQSLELRLGDFFVDDRLSGVKTLALVKYLESLPQRRRETVAGAVLKLVKH
ncbi:MULTISPECIES: helix-turn-helix domain-containing protein [Levilactobacillus]|uniref:HTH cro/C1-type domain-containing protein n=2 Tax=Levilactobacillus TaxID=2767886 RepID=A0A0R1LDP1_9LACO|nr:MULTISPECIES: helix-turn-helix transcriptional regulator [Levilactobacillus]KRK93902.1 hypothetical protein FD25_GL001229 [Levilactobacillus acidifarinae DSM 19394]KRL10514.1 hypothetical protein FD38_GL001874 [Levilactobacillus zymae DSM 19395]QFR60192.1 helix-turn-helix domain-containing protein [Levilactobacillus zymae]SMS14793.1 Putative DNA-binding protein, XRE family [Levilactobacillus zymae]GEO68790.1 transcriptional regulator [Levilactobacillus acidifarinae]